MGGEAGPFFLSRTPSETATKGGGGSRHWISARSSRPSGAPAAHVFAAVAAAAAARAPAPAERVGESEKPPCAAAEAIQPMTNGKAVASVSRSRTPSPCCARPSAANANNTAASPAPSTTARLRGRVELIETPSRDGRRATAQAPRRRVSPPSVARLGLAAVHLGHALHRHALALHPHHFDPAGQHHAVACRGGRPKLRRPRRGHRWPRRRGRRGGT